LKVEDKDITNPKSYRHICLLNVVSKIFDKVIAGKINNKRTNINECNLQFGFWKNKSTEDAINELVMVPF